MSALDKVKDGMVANRLGLQKVQQTVAQTASTRIC